MTRLFDWYYGGNALCHWFGQHFDFGRDPFFHPMTYQLIGWSVAVAIFYVATFILTNQDTMFSAVASVSLGGFLGAFWPVAVMCIYLAALPVVMASAIVMTTHLCISRLIEYRECGTVTPPKIPYITRRKTKLLPRGYHV